MLYTNTKKFWDHTKGYKTPGVFTGGFYHDHNSKSNSTISRNEFSALNRNRHMLRNDGSSDDIMLNQTIYRNYTTKPIWIIERSGLVYKLRPNTFTHLRPAIVKETQREINTDVLKTIVPYNDGKSHTDLQEIDLVAPDKFIIDSAASKHIKTTRYYHILEESHLDAAEHGVLYWAENDIVIVQERGCTIDYLHYILHPYSPRAKNYPYSNHFMESYDTMGRGLRHNLAFCIVNNSDEDKQYWMPLGTDAVPIPVVKDTAFIDGFYMFEDELINPTTKAQPCKIYTIEEAQVKYGIAKSKDDACKATEFKKVKEELKVQQEKSAIEREKIKASKEAEDRKYIRDKEKMQHEHEMEKRMRELNERKIEEDRQKQIRSQASERRSNNVSLIKEIVGFGVAILGIATIIMKARK